MHENVVFGTGMLVGVGLSMLAVTCWLAAHKHTPRRRAPFPLRLLGRGRGAPVVMFSAEEQARALRGEDEPDAYDVRSARPVYLGPERRATERPTTSGPAWAHLGSPDPRRTRDVHRPAASGEVLRFYRLRRRGQRDG